MDPQFITPFIKSVQNVFSTMLQLPVSIKDPTIKTGQQPFDVSGIIGAIGISMEMNYQKPKDW